MPRNKLLHLKARELKLLQERTDLLAQQERLIRSAEWPRSEVEEVSVRQDRIEAELVAIRAEIDGIYRLGE